MVGSLLFYAIYYLFSCVLLGYYVLMLSIILLLYWLFSCYLFYALLSWALLLYCYVPFIVSCFATLKLSFVSCSILLHQRFALLSFLVGLLCLLLYVVCVCSLLDRGVLCYWAGSSLCCKMQST